MLKIDCLLVNTEVEDTVRRLIGYLGHKGLADGTDVSFRKIYNELRKNKVEVDLETAAHLYAKELPIEDARFTSDKDLKLETSRWFDDLVRAVTLQKPKRGEKEIGELSPAQAAVKAFTNIFSNKVIEDERTKSILKTLEDLYISTGKRMLGEVPGEGKKADTRTAAEIIGEVLENEKLGFKNQKDGSINGLAAIHESVRSQIKDITKQMEATGDHDKIEQWENYAKSLEDATFTFMLRSDEASKIIKDSLMERGFVRVTKSGKRQVDWETLAGNVNSYPEIRKNVIDSLLASGISPDVANRVADSMSKEFRDIRGKLADISDRKQSKLADSWADSKTATRETLAQLVSRRVKEWNTHKGFGEGRENDPLTFSMLEAKKIIGNALKNSEQYGMDFGVDKRAINWANMATEKPSRTPLETMVKEQLMKDGVLEADATEAAFAATRDYYATLMDAITENSQRLLDTKQNALDRESPQRRSELSRLAELHDLGVFDGAHNRLLANVLGIEAQDVATMTAIREYAEKMSKLKHLMNGNDFLAASMQREVARSIQRLVASTIENKGQMMKVASAMNKIYQIENASLVSGYRNLIENHISGLMEYATTKINARQKLGKELAGGKGDFADMMKDVWKNITAGGAEFGLAPYQVGGNQTRVTDSYNLRQMKEGEWKDPKKWGKGVASAIMTVPRAFLSATDGMFKAGNYRLHFLSGMHDAMVRTGKYTSKEAIRVLNDAFYGDGQLAKAKDRARELYEKTGIEFVSQKEINITANELLAENLLREEALTPEMIQKVQESAFHLAGLGMGHESNNPMSSIIQSSKLAFQRKEQQAFVEGDYSKAAGLRMMNTAVNSIALRFAASQYNWAMIKLEQSGLGLISGIYHYQRGKRIKVDNLMTEAQQNDKMMEQAEQYQRSRQATTRGIMGLAANVLLTYGALPALARAMYQDEEDPVQALFDDMGDNFLAKALFLKTAPVWGLADYYSHRTKGGRPELETAAEVITAVTGFGSSHSNAVQFAEAAKSWKGSKEETNQKGDAKFGKLLGNNLPHVPFYRQAKDMIQTVDYFRTGKSPEYHYPETFQQGLWGGGVMDDLLDFVPPEQRPEWLDKWHRMK